MIDIGLITAYILTVLCVVAAIGIPLAQSLGDPKSLMKPALAVGALLVLFFLAYAVENGDTPGVSESTSKFSGAGLITFYLALFAALAGIVYTEISKIIK